MTGTRPFGALLTPQHKLDGRYPEFGQHRLEGELIWYHATDQVHVDIAFNLADRLTQMRPDVHLLLTAGEDIRQTKRGAKNVIWQDLPADTMQTATRFLQHWAPDICVWTAGRLRPVLLGQAHQSGIPLYLVDADESRLARSGWRLLPDASQSTLKRFAMIFARSTATEHHLRRKAGLKNASIVVTGPLREGSRPLSYSESDREELTTLMRGRAVWLAAHLRSDELASVLAANAAVLRIAHRALLVLSPESNHDLEIFQAELNASGLRWISWSDGQLPDESTQVILADTEGDLGLWYRVAPISFMGGSLATDAHGSDPNEPAAHGSAILHGPNVRSFFGAYSRFAGAGGARLVQDADSLASAVQSLIPPDKSAAMAHAAWDIATQGADVMDRLLEAIYAALDKQAVR